MLESLSPFNQTILSTFFTWGMTALGALCCILHYSQIESRYLLDISLGFSAGVMLAASYWSLLSPAEEMAIANGYGQFSFIPLAVGLLLGAFFVLLADKYAPTSAFAIPDVSGQCDTEIIPGDAFPLVVDCDLNHADDWQLKLRNSATKSQQQVSTKTKSSLPSLPLTKDTNDNRTTTMYRKVNPFQKVSRRLLLMIVAITIHNIPEGLAVGVAFGAVGQTKTATIAKARNLALGIGIQNFPEGLAVSLPLKAAGMSLGRSVWYGQLSGLVEPFAGLFGCVAVQLISPILPYALAFAAGAMIFVVFDDIIPETQQQGNGKMASVCALLGFVVMMSLDMSLG